jgi:TATA-box binding protein (TBP) (component of TFIID and TFIIIB)
MDLLKILRQKELLEKKHITKESDEKEDTKKIQPDQEKTQTVESTINTYKKLKNFLQKHKIVISTITLNCKLYVDIRLKKFAENIVLASDGISSIRYGSPENTLTNRCLPEVKKYKKDNRKKEKNKRENFYNQATILMNTNPKLNEIPSYMNIKVFNNGSLQISGCRNIIEFRNTMKKLIEILKTGNFIKSSNDNIEIRSLKISMINSGLNIGMRINREKLYKLLKSNHGRYTEDKEIGYVNVKYAPDCGHSCVELHYYHFVTKTIYVEIYIYVFHTGSVIITGAKNYQQIYLAYQFLMKIIKRYQNQIKIIPINYQDVKSDISKFYRKKKGKIILNY